MRVSKREREREREDKKDWKERARKSNQCPRLIESLKGTWNRPLIEKKNISDSPFLSLISHQPIPLEYR